MGLEGQKCSEKVQKMFKKCPNFFQNDKKKAEIFEKKVQNWQDIFKRGLKSPKMCLRNI